eukprot:4024705-Alexandrium_andersonii.AAC.1
MQPEGPRKGRAGGRPRGGGGQRHPGLPWGSPERGVKIHAYSSPRPSSAARGVGGASRPARAA